MATGPKKEKRHARIPSGDVVPSRVPEGIIPALESAHAVAHALKVAPAMAPRSRILVNLSGRGDKDLEEVARLEETMR